jgi:3-mercaptopyruvate sulfurtransferase SseA
MRLIFSCGAAIALAVVLLTGCNSNDLQGASKSIANENLSTQTPSDGVKRVTVTELKEMVDKGTVVIVDTRGPDAYAAEHIQGSINIPEANISARSGELPKDKIIVAYCS